MPTIYQRSVIFRERTGFIFSKFRKCQLGRRVSALWRELNGDAIALPRIESIEDTGTFTTFDYPDSFIPMIDQVLRNFRQDIIEEAHERKVNPPPPVIKPSPPQTLPGPRIRNRIPVKQKPAWKAK